MITDTNQALKIQRTRASHGLHRIAPAVKRFAYRTMAPVVAAGFLKSLPCNIAPNTTTERGKRAMVAYKARRG